MNKIIIATCIVLAGCSTSNQSSVRATKADEDAATKAYLNCATNQIRILDDGTSDARTIAIGATTACTAEYQHMSAVGAARRPTQLESTYYMRMAMNDPHRPDELIPLVLAIRKQKAER
ncbi:hypothetical protein [Burkholderia cepacia]|uniref:hypothetical protein n=1 Tax=Burkholderia cepacia TaxID=292 RepID=UPI00298FCD51|nr:hypothetical protein [Burkholderia cepacia]